MLGAENLPAPLGNEHQVGMKQIYGAAKPRRARYSVPSSTNIVAMLWTKRPPALSPGAAISAGPSHPSGCPLSS
jgi:hypothetical protein